MPLTSGPVAGFYRELMDRLDGLGLHTAVWTMPVEIPDAIPFDDDTTHTVYDGDQARRFWRLPLGQGMLFWIVRAPWASVQR